MRLIAARPAAAETIAGALAGGVRRVAFLDHRSFAGPEGLMPLVARFGGPTLVLVDFSQIRRTVEELRAVTARDDVGTWGGDARIVVANYEKVGLYLRFVDPDEFRLVAMMEHGPENDRAARAIADRLGGTSMLQVVRSRGEAAFLPDVTLTRHEDGRIDRADRLAEAATAA